MTHEPNSSFECYAVIIHFFRLQFWLLPLMTFALEVLRSTKLPVILNLGRWAITTSQMFFNLGYGFENCKIMDLDLIVNPKQDLDFEILNPLISDVHSACDFRGF